MQHKFNQTRKVFASEVRKGMVWKGDQGTRIIYAALQNIVL